MKKQEWYKFLEKSAKKKTPLKNKEVEKITKFLDMLKLTYVKNYHFPNFRSVLGGRPWFTLVLVNKDKIPYTPWLVIEIKNEKFLEKNLEKQKFCASVGIPFLELTGADLNKMGLFEFKLKLDEVLNEEDWE